MLPFTVEQFFAVVSRYHAAIAPPDLALWGIPAAHAAWERSPEAAGLDYEAWCGVGLAWNCAEAGLSRSVAGSVTC